MAPHLFDEVGDALRSMAPDGLGEVRFRSHRYGIKVWTGPATPPKEHYEAQFIRRRHIDDGEGSALEIGFHAEHPVESKNEATIQRLLAARKDWQPELGGDVQCGSFLGKDSWRRLSEVWLDPEPDDPDLAFEIASRIVDYLDVIEPIRQGSS